jgi:hypothetical protein
MTSKQLAAGVIIFALVVVAAGVLVWYQAPPATTTSADFNDLDGLLQDLDDLVSIDNQYSPADMEDVAAG